MKKLFSLILAVVMVFSLVACGSEDKEMNSNNETPTNNSTTQQETERNDTNESKEETTALKNEFEREMTADGYVVISMEEFASYLTKIELTTENWKDYLDIIEVIDEERNGFGEITYSETSVECTAKDVLGCYFDDVAISFKVNATGETLYCEGLFYRLYDPEYRFSWDDYTIDDLTCEEIIGDLIILDNVPDECISTYEDGGMFICVGSADDYIVMNINTPKDISMDISLAYAIYN